jgi:hypothetical protein
MMVAYQINKQTNAIILHDKVLLYSDPKKLRRQGNGKITAR